MTPTPLDTIHRRGLFLAQLVAGVLLFAASLAHADLAPQNGDVMIGEALDGPALVRSRVPTQPLLVTVDSPYEVFGSTGTLIHVAAWTADGHPARGAEVYFEEALVGRTDDTGTLVFRWGVPDDEAAYWRRGGTVSVRWSQGGRLYGGDVSFNANPRTGSFASDHVFVYTDRGIYNPGDLVRVRALAWHLAADYSPLAEAEIELLLRAPDGRVVAAASAETDAWGVTALELPVAAHVQEGIYTLSASYEDATAEARLRVERYTPPIIEISHTLGRFLTLDQRELSFEVTLGYFTGAQFEGGQLAVDVLVEGSSRFRYEMAVEGPGPHAVTIDREALTAIRRGLRERDLVEVEIAATDIYGRRDDLTRELRFFRNPYLVVIEKDRDYYSPGDAIELIVRLSDRDRVPVRSTEVTLQTSTGGSYTVVSDDTGMAQFSLEMPSTDLRVEVLLADVGSAVAAATVPLQGAQPMRSHIGEAIVRENEPAHVVVRFPSHFIPAESVVHLDVVDTSGALVQAVLLPVRSDDEGWIAEGDLAAPSWGSMLLTFFCLGRDTTETGSGAPGRTFLGLMTEGQNLAVYPGRELTITLDGLPDELAPGDAFTADIRVTGANGEAVDAIVGAAMVDQAVISLRDPLEITPMDYFYNPRLRVLSSTGSAILTWPVVSRNWGDNRHDVALPPFPFRSGGRVDGVFDGERKIHFGDNDDADLDEDDLALAPQGDLYSLAGDYGAAWLPERVAEAPPVITIRTDFPDTSLWEPYLEAFGGGARIAGRVPDAITTQQLTLVASDRQGGVGVLRVPLRVTQDLTVRADLPDHLTVGDDIEARVVVENHSPEARRIEVSLAGESVTVDGGTQTLEVAAGGVGVATFRLQAGRAGPASVVASARMGERQDLEERLLWVRPLGLPDLTIETRTLTSEAPVGLAVALPEDGQMATVSLNVAFPAVTAGFAGLEAIQARLAGADAMSMGGEMMATASLYEYQKARGADSAQLSELRAALSRGQAHFLSAQRPDGGWGYCWDAESQPYITAYVLDVLAALDRASLPVPREAFRQAVELLASEQVDGRWTTSAVAFWEGDSEAVQLGLSAQIFSTLARLPSRARTPAWRRAIEASAPLFEAYLGAPNPDPLTLAYSILGLRAAAEASVIEPVEGRFDQAVAALDAARRDGYWEPSWFNAYGGTIEATVAALEVYAALGRSEELAHQQRDAVRYLLSTRDEWGGWHNPWGTAAAIRGLLLLDPERESAGAELTLRIDGREIQRVALDADDPFLSVGALRELDLTPWLTRGDTHWVTVEYDGQLEPDVRLTLRHWRAPSAVAGEAVGLDAALSVHEAAVDEIVRYTLSVHSREGRARRVRLDVAPPSNAELDESSLEGLVSRGLIDAYEATESGWRLSLRLEARESRDVDLVLVARRRGEAVIPVAVAQVLGVDGDDTERLAVAVPERTFTVR